MIVDDLWTAKGPAPADLKVLERLAQRRLALEAFEAPDEEEAIVIARALATLDNMEECLCEEGRRAPLIAHGWMTLEQLEARLTDLQATPVAAPPEREDAASTKPGFRPPRVVDIRRDLRSQKPSIEGSPSPHYPGDSNLLITSIETLRSIAHRAAEDSSPGVGMPPVDEAIAFLPRATALVNRLLGGKLDLDAVHIEAQALSIYMSVFDLCRRTSEPEAPVKNESELTIRDEARIDLLRQERAARAQRRNGATTRARPHRPPETRRAESEEAWNDLLDLISESLEIFIRFHNEAGIDRCLETLDLISEAFAIDQSDVA